MATLHQSGANRKVFTPISSALGALSNGAGTIIVLIRRTVDGGTDFAGLTNSAVSSWYHMLGIDNGDFVWDDDEGQVTPTATNGQDLTNWWMYAVDWPTGTAQTERFHWRDQTGGGAGSPGSWTHSAAFQANTGQRAGPGTGGWFSIGYNGDWSVGEKDMAVVAVYNYRFADGDYGDFRKTSDLYNASGGAPIFLCECTATTLVDLIGASTYSSANSSGGALTGPDPDNWTLDGVGNGASPVGRNRSRPLIRT